MSEDEKGFRVVDRRGNDSDKKKETPAQGEGFTMQEEDARGPHEIDFSTFIFSLATGALINMGLAPDPTTRKVEKNLEIAKQNIDLLGIIKDKTKGNLTNDENALLDNLLTEVRFRFVEASKK